MDKIKFVHNQIIIFPLYPSVTDAYINDVIDAMKNVSEVYQI